MPMPETEAPGRLQAEMLARGVRLTRQRRTILGIIETADQHLDAGMILRKARKLDSTIDRVTVYRTLKLLKRHGLIDELDLLHIRGDGHYYERHPQREHIHLACLRPAGQPVAQEDEVLGGCSGVVEPAVQVQPELGHRTRTRARARTRPRTRTRTGPSFATTSSDLMVRAGSIFRREETSAMVRASGVETSSSLQAGKSGRGGCEDASSTLAA